jgi:hypothetical protein
LPPDPEVVGISRVRGVSGTLGRLIDEVQDIPWRFGRADEQLQPKVREPADLLQLGIGVVAVLLSEFGESVPCLPGPAQRPKRARPVVGADGENLRERGIQGRCAVSSVQLIELSDGAL